MRPKLKVVSEDSAPNLFNSQANMAILDVITYPDPFLARIAEPVKIIDNKIKKLVDLISLDYLLHIRADLLSHSLNPKSRQALKQCPLRF